MEYSKAPLLRVCHVIDTLNVGGAERQFVDLLNALPGVERYAVILKDSRCRAGFRSLLDPTVKTFSLNVRLRYAPVYIAVLGRWMLRERLDVVHSHMFWPTLYGTTAARIAGIPVVASTDHGTNPWKRKRHDVMDRILAAAVDRRFCVSDDIVRKLTDVGVRPEKLRRMVNGTTIPEPITVEHSSPIRIGAMGRFVWQKDYENLLRACAILKKRGMEFRLSLAGDGPLRERLEQAVDRNDIRGQVNLPGFQKDVDSWLRGQDIFVISSVEEGQPVVLLEAMARGFPIVATRVGGIPDTIRNEREGLLVDPLNPDALADAIYRLSSSLELRRQVGRNARERAIEEFSMEAVAAKYLREYQELYATSKGKGALARRLSIASK